MKDKVHLYPLCRCDEAAFSLYGLEDDSCQLSLVVALGSHLYQAIGVPRIPVARDGWVWLVHEV